MNPHVDKFLLQQSEWLKGKGPLSGIVISTRIRLARNLAKYPFPLKAGIETRKKILDEFESARKKVKELKEGLIFNLEELSSLDRDFFVERHLMSVEFSKGGMGQALLVSKDEVFSIMINEEDHFRIQVIKSGFNLKETWNYISSIDDKLSQRLEFAFSADFGFLTACPTNVGTGLRGSVMLHLPGLVLLKRINKVLSLVSKLNFAVRGLFGEGTQAIGNFFQVSNQVTLGRSEEELLDNIEGVVRQVVEREEEARDILLRKEKLFLEDRIWRSYGILKNCHIISSQEALDLISMLRLGLDLGIIKSTTTSLLNELFILIQPAHLQKLEGKVLSSQQRDIIRAKLIRERLA